MKRTRCLTLCGALSALTVAVLYLGSLVEVLDLVTALVGACLVAMAVIEMGRVWALGMLTATSLLALLLLPNKFVGLTYCLMALCTLLKSIWERLSPALSWLGKYLSFNLLYAATLAVSLFVLGMELDTLVVFGVQIPPYGVILALVLAGNLLYLLCDVALTRLIAVYYARYHTRVARWLK